MKDLEVLTVEQHALKQVMMHVLRCEEEKKEFTSSFYTHCVNPLHAQKILKSMGFDIVDTFTLEGEEALQNEGGSQPDLHA